MEYRSLGKSDLLVSPIVLGTWQFDSTAWEGSNERDSIRTVHAALDLGINTVDTAEAYGESEEILGKAVEGRRDKVCIVSKANRRPEEIRSTVEQSLSRLRTDYIDVYLAHYPPKAPPYYSVLEELDRLREEGKLRALGVSNFTRYQLEQTLSVLRFDVCEPPFNIIWREIELNGVLEFCRRNDISVLSYSSMAQGLLAGAFLNKPVPDDIHKQNKLFQSGTYEASNRIAGHLGTLGEKYGRTAAQIALNWVLHTPGITAAIAGAERPWQIESALGALDWRLDQGDYDELSDQGRAIAKSLDYTTNMWNVAPQV